MTSGHWAATAKRTSASLRRWRGSPRSILDCIGPSCSHGCDCGPTKVTPNGCGGCTRFASPTRCSLGPIRSWSTLRPLPKMCAQNRQPVSRDNAFWQAQERFGKAIEGSLTAYGDMRDHLVEMLFHGIYGSPLLQSFVGLKASDASPRHRPGVDAVYRAFIAQRVEELRQKRWRGRPA